MRLISIFTVCLLLSGCVLRNSAVPERSGSARDGAATVVIRGATIIDVADGSRRPGRTVVVEGGRIAAVHADGAAVVDADAVVVDASGRYLIPGLWDMHTHSLNQLEWALPLHVANGVTGIRDMATSMPMAELDGLRERIRSGHAVGPRIVASGPLVDGPNSFHDYVKVATPGAGRAVVDSLHRAGVDFIKVYEELPRDVFVAVVDAARELGLPVAGHVPIAFENAAEAVEAGMRSVEHVDYLMFVCTANGPLVRSTVRAAEALGATGDSTGAAALFARAGELWDARLATYDAAACEAEGRRLAARGTWLAPTLSLALRSNAPPVSIEFGTLVDRHGFRYVPRATLEQWRRRYEAAVADTLEHGYDRERAEREGILAAVRDAHRVGAPLLAGTDGSAAFQVYGFNLHEELGFLVEAGLTPLEALQTATLNPARYLGREGEHGTIAPGAVADLVLLESDPLLDIANTRSIVAVVADGRLFRRADLDALLDSVARAAPSSSP